MIVTKVKCEIRVIALHLSKATGFLASASLAFLSRCGKMKRLGVKSARGRQATAPLWAAGFLS